MGFVGTKRYGLLKFGDSFFRRVSTIERAAQLFVARSAFGSTGDRFLQQRYRFGSAIMVQQETPIVQKRPLVTMRIIVRERDAETEGLICIVDTIFSCESEREIFSSPHALWIERECFLKCLLGLLKAALRVIAPCQAIPGLRVIGVERHGFLQPVDRVRIVVEQNIVESDNPQVIAARRREPGGRRVGCQRVAWLVLAVLNEPKHEERFGGIGMKLQVAGQSSIRLVEALEISQRLALEEQSVGLSRVLLFDARHERGRIFPVASFEGGFPLIVEGNVLCHERSRQRQRDKKSVQRAPGSLAKSMAVHCASLHHGVHGLVDFYVAVALYISQSLHDTTGPADLDDLCGGFGAKAKVQTLIAR